MVTSWFTPRVPSSAVHIPRPEVGPNSAWLSDCSSVIQVTVACDCVIFEEPKLERTGAVVSAVGALLPPLQELLVTMNASRMLTRQAMLFDFRMFADVLPLLTRARFVNVLLETVMPSSRPGYQTRKPVPKALFDL